MISCKYCLSPLDDSITDAYGIPICECDSAEAARSRTLVATLRKDLGSLLVYIATHKRNGLIRADAVSTRITLLLNDTEEQ